MRKGNILLNAAGQFHFYCWTKTARISLQRAVSAALHVPECQAGGAAIPALTYHTRFPKRRLHAPDAFYPRFQLPKLRVEHLVYLRTGSTGRNPEFQEPQVFGQCKASLRGAATIWVDRRMKSATES